MTMMKNKCNKWTLVFLFYSLFIYNTICTVNGAPEKLTQEQVLEELGVKIETKGKNDDFQYHIIAQIAKIDVKNSYYF